MERAYVYVTLRHGILIGINEAGMEGIMFNFIQNFLTPRSFEVKVNEILSDAKVQTEGKPQGRVVRSTFFIPKIIEIVAQLPNENRFQISLYMDDLPTSHHVQIGVL